MSHWRKEKDVALLMAANGRKTKSANLPPKNVPELLPGHVEVHMVKCGKQRCKCARGELHGPYFYHFTWSENRRTKTYVRLSDVNEVVLACKLYRDLQLELREGRKIMRALMARVRGLRL